MRLFLISSGTNYTYRVLFITPNKDGLNELLKVFPVGIRSFNFFAVYNRYGQQVFYTTNYSEGWDGTYKGKSLLRALLLLIQLLLIIAVIR
jgi:gliding motility-associated-like protein